jgi:diguanylate cyclase (GGDEF)-like protein
LSRFQPEQNLLVVEDSLTQAFALQKLLQENGFKVERAGNGEEALEILKKGEVDLVLSDIEMPVINGFELCRLIKEDRQMRTLPVVLLTTLSETDHILQGLVTGADYYLTKPYHPRHLVDRLRQILEEWQPEMAVQEEEAMEFRFQGRTHVVRAGKRQMLNLLLSTYENAVLQNRELIRTQLELSQRNQQLKEQQLKLAEANDRLSALATEDALTGLKNVRCFRERLAEEFQRAERYQLPLSVILLDVDRFKEFNDSFGHPAGDQVLREVARCIREGCRTTDFAARYGGEEFVVLLPNTPETEAREVAGRIRRTIEEQPWKERKVTSSFGVAGYGPEHGTEEALIQAADQALYRSKKSGRNRVTCWNEMGAGSK